jgi:capsular exopolysaccharide synthesis family protein
MKPMSATIGLTSDQRGTGMRITDGGDAENFLRVLLRRYRLVLACCLIGLTLAVAIVLLVPPRYSARAVMRVDTDDIDTSSLQSTLSSTRELELRRDHQIETQLQLLSSRPLMRRVVNTLALYDDPEFNPAGDVYGKVTPVRNAKGNRAPISPLMIEAVTDRLIGVVRIAQDGQTSFLNIDVSSRSAGKAARIANKIVSIYVETQVSEKKASNARAIQALDRQVSDLRQQLISIERGAASYKREHRLDGTASDDNRAGQIGQLADALAVARGARAEAEVRAGGTTRDRADMTSPLLTSLREQETETRRRLADLTITFGRGQPDVQKTEAQLAEIRRSISAESTRVQGELQRETTAQRAREAQLAHELQTAQSRSLDEVITAVPLADMERNADATRAVYVGLLGRLDGLIRENELVRPDATIAFTALPPTSPSSPQVARILVIATAGSVLLSLILVLIVEQLDTRLRTGEEVLRITGLSTLGMVPQLRRRRQAQLTSAGAIDQPYSAFTEEIRSICGRIARLLPESQGGVVLISSPEPGDGKTTIALALAAAAIATGRSAIVVDLDLRRPELAERLGQRPDAADIVSFLREEAQLDDVIVACPAIPSLKSLSALTAAEDPGALLVSHRLRLMLDQLRARFDFIIVNTPPVLAVNDAVAVAPMADVVLMVVGWGRTSQSTLRSAAMQFDDGITGVVFNHVGHGAHRRAAYEDYVYDGSNGARWYRAFARRRRGRALTSRQLTHGRPGATAVG